MAGRHARLPVRRSTRLSTLLAGVLLLATGTPAAAAPAAPASLAPAWTDHGLASAIVPGSVDRTSLDLAATYDVTARLGWADRSLRVTTTIELTNVSGGPIDRLELNSVAARLGRMRLGTASVDGADVPASVDDQTIHVPLGGVLPDGASAVVRLVYSATLRSGTGGSDWMFTRANGIADLYRWIPWISRRRAFDRPNHGDPFVTPVASRVTLRIVTDRRLRIAVNGRRTAVSADGLRQTFIAENVRDLPVTAAPDYRITTGTVDGVTVRVFARPGAPASTMLSWARRALGRMADLVGPYPYPALVVAQSAGGYGMEGPGVVWLPAGIAASRVPYLASHEIAHQWFYGLVGSDQATQPFADEAAADFLARYTLGARRASRCATGRLDLSIYRYSSACYYEVVYVQGGNVLDDLRRRMGDARFWEALRAYLDENRWGIAGTRRLLDALDAGTPLDLSARLRPRFPSLYPA